ncbi:MAG: phosphatase PAP2 family protein [Candidatus Krumholzibacteriia bacterium]
MIPCRNRRRSRRTPALAAAALAVVLAMLLSPAHAARADGACAGAAPAEVSGGGRGNGRGVLGDAAHGVEMLVRDTVHILTSPLRMNTGDALQVGGVLAAAGALMIFDEEIQDAADRNAGSFPLRPLLETGRFLDPVGYGRMNTYYAGGLVASYAAGWETGTAMFGQILTSFTVYGLLKFPVQDLVGRRRPYEDAGAYRFGVTDASSFPSGHTINVIQVATVVSHHVERAWFTWIAYGLAAGVALQRIESDAHWPSDVLLSAVFGVAVARGVIALQEERRLAVVPHTGPQGTGLAAVVRF